MAEKLGERLLKGGSYPSSSFKRLFSFRKPRGKLGFNLIKLGFVKEEEITSLLSEQYGVPAIHLEHFDIDESVLKHVPADIAQKYLLIPIERTGATLTIAMADPSNIFALDNIGSSRATRSSRSSPPKRRSGRPSRGTTAVQGDAAQGRDGRAGEGGRRGGAGSHRRRGRDLGTGSGGRQRGRAGRPAR